MGIPVVIVDDEGFDRQIARRRLGSNPEFSDLFEYSSGTDFLNGIQTPEFIASVSGKAILVLMDINMPGKNGFEVIEEFYQHTCKKDNQTSCVAIMLTSSENPADYRIADNLEVVKGYVPKPLDKEGLERILLIFREICGQ